MNVPTFQEATEKGTIVGKEGYHQPNNQPTRWPNCGCSNTTKKGAYRDVSVKMPNGMIVHFYHQTPVVVEHNGTYWLNNGGYETSSTKERINRYLPSGYVVRQKDKEWYLITYDPSVPYDQRESEWNSFENEMTIEV